MDEYISREVAVKQITSLCEQREIVCGANDEFLRGLKKALITVKSYERIPSANVQPVMYTEWVHLEQPAFGNPYGCYQCPECKYIVPYEENYCPNCGVKMILRETDETAVADESDVEQCV